MHLVLADSVTSSVWVETEQKIKFVPQDTQERRCRAAAALVVIGEGSGARLQTSHLPKRRSRTSCAVVNSTASKQPVSNHVNHHSQVAER